MEILGKKQTLDKIYDLKETGSGNKTYFVIQKLFIGKIYADIIKRHKETKGKNDCTTTKFIFTACHKDLKGHAYMTYTQKIDMVTYK